MNINPEKIKELVLAYSELDEEYQNRLLKEAYKLQLMQTQKKQIIKGMQNIQQIGIGFTAGN